MSNTHIASIGSKKTLDLPVQVSCTFNIHHFIRMGVCYHFENFLAENLSASNSKCYESSNIRAVLVFQGARIFSNSSSISSNSENLNARLGSTDRSLFLSEIRTLAHPYPGASASGNPAQPRARINFLHQLACIIDVRGAFCKQAVITPGRSFAASRRIMTMINEGQASGKGPWSDRTGQNINASKVREDVSFKQHR